MHKRAFIKDPLWGTVEFFSWESCVTNHFIFNRLTNIIQNSSAFRAYPGLKYSRFLHTIGVVHVVTQLFPNSLKNAEPSHLNALRKEAVKADAYLSPSQVKLIRKELSGHLGGNVEFAVLLAALRMSAFIHDLGHLPYSHVFENALESLNSKGIEGTIKIKRETAPLRAKLIRLLEKGSPATGSEHEKIHERVGMQLATALRQELRTQDGTAPQLSAELIRIAYDLLCTSDFPIAKTFIKGTVDADRIDFVRRDGHFSGLFRSGVDYGRLFTLYTLEEIKVEGDDANKNRKKTPKVKIVACPSTRAVSETEKLLWERFQDYKYIVMHHKVHLYDEIVENIIVHLLADGKFDRFLEDLIYLLETGHDHAAGSIHSKKKEFLLLSAILLEFDDPWLESHIRSIYRDSLDTVTTKSKNPDTDILFQVYVEERGRFTSAFKSDCEFWDAVNDFAKRLRALHPQEPPSGESIRNERYYFFNALYGIKFSLQSHLKKKLGYSVIVGPTERKVNYGIRNDNEAAFYQINELLDFLKLKKYRTMLFNLWFDEGAAGITREKFLAEALPIIEKAVFEALDDLRGEQSFKFDEKDKAMVL